MSVIGFDHGDEPGVSNGEAKVYEVVRQPIHQRQKMRIICVGAGLAGIAAAYKYMERLQDAEFVIYEKNHDVGGTWLENRYPGCACDIPAHGYTYSWEGNPNWSRFYVSAEEIFEYFKGCAVKWDCMKFVKLSHRVVRAQWSEEKATWEVEIQTADGSTFVDECNVFLSATGILNNWKWPEIPGLHLYKGHLVHSAKWDKDYEFTGKTIAVIGAGSSAIQIVPELRKGIFIRGSTWITPEFSESLAAQGRETTFSSDEIARFNKDKDYFLKYRKDSELQKQAVMNFGKLMRQRLNYDEGLAEHLIPKFPVGCRRFTPGTGFLEALVEPNVTVIKSGISQFEEDGIRTSDGQFYKVDAIVCATGFDCSFRPTFPVIGRNGQDLRDVWQDTPRHYMSVTVPGFPNYFMTGGPNSPIANGSLIAGLEAEIDYAYTCVEKLQRENGASMEVSDDATQEFMEHKDAAMEKFVWSENCKSWYVLFEITYSLDVP
ncbi:monooxygenase [Fusarium coicis]|nr:monooxygenase [Fusarium coicis]